MEAAENIDVLIVGAGPAGLMMAAQLLRFGIQPMIIDRKSGPDQKTKAIAIQARSLEYFDQLGLAEKLLQTGIPIQTVAISHAGQALETVDFSQIDTPPTAYPYVYLTSQKNTEKVLRDRLTERACPVYWETELTALQQDDSGADVMLASKGLVRPIRCQWVIGADGAGSFVRRSVHIPFEGKTYKGDFFLADVTLAEAPKPQIRLCLQRGSFLGIFSLGEQGNYRLMGTLPKTVQTSNGPLAYALIKKFVDRTYGSVLPVSTCHWINRFELHKRIASSFMQQRTFLIGDAAHIHSPLGGQGMNTGMHDAANLAWKLAGVIKGTMKPQLLNTYQQERMPIAKTILDTTDRLFSAVIGRHHTMMGLLSPFLLPMVFRFLSKDVRRLTKVFATLGQLDQQYRHSVISVHHSSATKVKAGDRLPYLSVFDEKLKEETHLHRWSKKSGFLLLILGTIGTMNIDLLGRWIKQHYPQDMHLFYLPFSERNREVFQQFEVLDAGVKMILVRPDMHIAFTSDALNIGLIENYMETGLGWKADRP